MSVLPVIIRPYTEADYDALLKGMHELQGYIADIDPLHRHRKGSTFEAKAYLHRLFENLEADNGRLYLAFDGERMIGFVAGIVPNKQSPDDLLEIFPSKDGKILELYVDRSYRGKQIGRILMENIENYFKSAGCVACHTDCFGPNDLAHTFYHKYGYFDRLITLMKILK
jgi:ribosomal protein S18 acetylase RimI-like enzyme